MEKPKVYKIQFVKWIKNGDHVEYLITLLCMDDQTINVEFNERYSTLRDLNELLRKEANSINFPKFPPKKLWGNTDEKFLNQRLTALQHYFNTILGSKDFSQLNSLKKWIEYIIKKHNKQKNAANNNGLNRKSGENTFIGRNESEAKDLSGIKGVSANVKEGIKKPGEFCQSPVSNRSFAQRNSGN